MIPCVSYDTDYVNAFWDGTRMTCGDGNGTSRGPLVSLDIVGHEVSHGVTGNSANLKIGVMTFTAGAAGSVTTVQLSNDPDPAWISIFADAFEFDDEAIRLDGSCVR